MNGTTSSLPVAGYLSTSGCLTVDSNDNANGESVTRFEPERLARRTLIGSPGITPDDAARGPAIENTSLWLIVRALDKSRIPGSGGKPRSDLFGAIEADADCGTLASAVSGSSTLTGFDLGPLRADLPALIAQFIPYENHYERYHVLVYVKYGWHVPDREW